MQVIFDNYPAYKGMLIRAINLSLPLNKEDGLVGRDELYKTACMFCASANFTEQVHRACFDIVCDELGV